MLIPSNLGLEDNQRIPVIYYCEIDADSGSMFYDSYTNTLYCFCYSVYKI